MRLVTSQELRQGELLSPHRLFRPLLTICRVDIGLRAVVVALRSVRGTSRSHIGTLLGHMPPYGVACGRAAGCGVIGAGFFGEGGGFALKNTRC